MAAGEESPIGSHVQLLAGGLTLLSHLCLPGLNVATQCRGHVGRNASLRDLRACFLASFFRSRKWVDRTCDSQRIAPSIDSHRYCIYEKQFLYPRYLVIMGPGIRFQ